MGDSGGEFSGGGDLEVTIKGVNGAEESPSPLGNSWTLSFLMDRLGSLTSIKRSTVLRVLSRNESRGGEVVILGRGEVGGVVTDDASDSRELRFGEEDG